MRKFAKSIRFSK